MWCVVAAIGTDGLLGTEALQSCLPHQLDLRTGQLWADGRSTLQLHQQRSPPVASCSLMLSYHIVDVFYLNESTSSSPVEYEHTKETGANSSFSIELPLGYNK